jgi:hypothetical protein
MFLACRSGCGHWCSILDQGGDTPHLAAFLRLSYCTRFLPKYKVRHRCHHCGNRWEITPAILRLTQALPRKRSSIITATGDLRNFKLYKACCCDECCGTVETLTTNAERGSYADHWQVAVCGNSGKQNLFCSVTHSTDHFIHYHQQILRSISSTSSQVLVAQAPQLAYREFSRERQVSTWRN